MHSTKVKQDIGELIVFSLYVIVMVLPVVYGFISAIIGGLANGG